MSEGTDKHLEHAEHAQHHAHNPFDRRVAVTMAILAAILAGVTLVSHRGHTKTLQLATEASSLHTQATDVWNLYQAKNIRSHEFQSYLFLEELLAKDGVKQDDASMAMRHYWIDQVNKYEGEGFWPKFKASVLGAKDGHETTAKKLAEKKSELKHGQLAEHYAQAKSLEAEAKKHEDMSQEVHHDVTWVDYGHLGLELALVFCAVAVLTKQKQFWLTGIGFGLIGSALAAYGMWGLWTLPAIGVGGAGHH
jgi:hypothetical protein